MIQVEERAPCATAAATPSPATRLERGRRVVPQLPAIDGLRAVAVGGVVLYHLPVSWIPGGFIGVDMFFVISGFLITSLLLSEITRTRTIALGQFYVRRARRLLPALFFMLAVIIVIAAVAAPGALSLLRTDVLAALGYFTNWWLIGHHVSYFQSIGRPPLLLHLWSLAIEEQFYLVWPLVVLAVARRGRHTNRVGWVALVGAIASSLWMAALYHPFQDPSRAYFGTDAHCSGLLIGAALSVAFPPWRRSENITPAARRLLGGAGLAAFGGLVVLMLTLTQYGSFTYRGGLQLANILAGVLVVVASHPAVRALDVFASPAMRWIGKRSYAIYLWHWPIFQLTRPYQDVPFGGWGLNALRLGAVVLAADVSYRLVEQPWRTGAAPAAIRKWWASNRVWVFSTTGVAVAGVTCLVVVLVMAPESSVPPALAAGSTPAARSTITPATTDPARDRRVVQTTEPSTTAGRALVAQPGTHRTRPAPTVTTAPRTSVPAGHKTTDTAHATTTGPRTLVAAGHKTTDTAPTTTTPPAPAPPPVVLAIGDSVMLDAASELQARFGPATVIDASVGRQVAAGIQRLGEYRTAGRLRTLTVLVIGLGTNGPMDPTQCQQILSLAAGIPRVIMVNVRMPRPWEPVTNNTLTSCTAGVPHVTLVNWYTASAAPGILGPDGIHATIAGAERYTALIAAAAG